MKLVLCAILCGEGNRMKFSAKKKAKRMAEFDVIVADIAVNGLWDKDKVDYNDSNFINYRN